MAAGFTARLVSPRPSGGISPISALGRHPRPRPSPRFSLRPLLQRSPAGRANKDLTQGLHRSPRQPSPLPRWAPMRTGLPLPGRTPRRRRSWLVAVGRGRHAAAAVVAAQRPNSTLMIDKSFDLETATRGARRADRRHRRSRRSTTRCSSSSARTYRTEAQSIALLLQGVDGREDVPFSSARTSSSPTARR